MPVFVYKAVDEAGLPVSGEIERENIDLVFDYIKAAGLMPIDIKKATFFNRDLLASGFMRPHITQNELSVFCRQIAFLSEAGIPITAAFSILCRQASSRQFKAALFAVSDSLQKGYSLGDSMEECRVFPSFLVGMARVGELSGRQDTVFSKMADYYEKKAKTREELQSALLYPALVALMMLAVIIVAVGFVVPNYAAMFASAGVELPLVTRLLISSSRFVVDYYIFLTALPAFMILGLVFFYQSKRGRRFFHWLLLNLPFCKTIYRKILNLNFARTMCILLDAGVLLLQSVDIAKKVLDNSIMDDIFDAMAKGIGEGRGLGCLMENAGYFEPLLCSMVRIGEETGSLPRVMEKSAEYFQSQTDSLLVRVNKLIEPVLIVVLGIVLGFIMLAILLPTFTLAYFV